MKVTTVVAALALPLALGCSRKGAGAPSRAPVTVARAEQRPVPYEISATGTAEPRRTASVQSQDRKSTRLNSSHLVISYAVFCLKKKKKEHTDVHSYCGQVITN